MAYFSQQFIDFFQGLSDNNRKEWFDEHRKTYEKEVKEPFKQFVDMMILRIHAFEPDIQETAKTAIFRINRDIRFSKDKTPYKPHASAAISRGGKKSSIPGYYFQLSHQGIWVGGGSYFLEKDELYKVRQEIVYETKAFQAVVRDENFRKHFGEVKGEKNKVLPAEFKEIREEEPLVANKQFYYMATLDKSLIKSDELPDVLMGHFEAGRPLNQFLKKAMEVE